MRTLTLTHHQRYTYYPIHQRPAFNWPEGKHLAVYIALNLEHFAFGEGLGAELAPGGPQPDILNYAWRDYGNRVGVWRLLDLFNEFKFPVAILVNSTIYDYCPQVIAAFRERGDEIVAHGHTNSERQSTFNREQEAEFINEVTAVILKHEKKHPQGWLGPWIAESLHTPDLLKAAGYQYLLDWCHDDQPIWFKTSYGEILSIPYPQEINDIPAIVVRKASAAEFTEMIIDNFDEMLRQSSQQALVFGIALHPYVMGQPFRIKQLRRALKHISEYRSQIWFTYPGGIADYFTSLNFKDEKGFS